MAHSSACARPDGWAHDESHRRAQADGLDVLIGLARDTPAGPQRPSAGPPKPEHSAALWPQGWTAPAGAGGQSADPVHPAPADGHVPELRPLNGRAGDAPRGYPRRRTGAADPLNGWRRDGRGMNGGPVNGRAGNGPSPASSIVKRRPASLRYGAPSLKGRVPEPRSETPRRTPWGRLGSQRSGSGQGEWTGELAGRSRHPRSIRTMSRGGPERCTRYRTGQRGCGYPPDLRRHGRKGAADRPSPGP